MKAHVAQYVKLLSHATISITKTRQQFRFKIGVIFSHNGCVAIMAMGINEGESL